MSSTEAEPQKLTRKELEALFKDFDKDGSGHINVAELKEAVHKYGLGLSDEEIKDMVKDADKDGNEGIDLEEFIRVMSGDS